MNEIWETQPKAVRSGELILIGKIHIWDCRRMGVRSNLEGFKLKIEIKYETEKYILTKNNNLVTFSKKWIDNFSL